MRIVSESNALHITVALARIGGGGVMQSPPLSFSGMDAKRLGGSRWNFAQLMGHPLRNFCQKKYLTGSGQVTEL